MSGQCFMSYVLFAGVSQAKSSERQPAAAGPSLVGIYCFVCCWLMARGCCSFRRCCSAVVACALGKSQQKTGGGGKAQARIPAPGQSPPYSLSRFLFGCSLNAVMFDGGVLTVLPLDCCCILLSVPAVCLVYGLVSTAHPSLCMPSVLAAAAIAGGICFFAPYVTCY